MLKGFPDERALTQSFRCDVSQLAAVFRSVKASILAQSSVRRMAMTVAALHVAAKVIDFHITKYAAKPTQRLQNLVTQYALGLRRLELEEEVEKTASAENGDDAAQVAARDAEPKVRGRKVMLRLQHAANRSKWISATESALYVHTEQHHFSTHNEVPMFASRALFCIMECKRMLMGGKGLVTRADTAIHFSVLDFECGVPPSKGKRNVSLQVSAVETEDQHKRESLGDVPQLASTATGLHNVGNTCFPNALLQGFRQIL